MVREKLISVALCALGVFKSIQPHWLYFDQFVLANYPNMTTDELQTDVYPARDYSCLILTLVVVMVTDYVKYKPIIILQSFFSVILSSLIIWDQEVVPLIVSQVFRGFVIATDVAFYSYIYSIVSAEKYKLNTCLTQVSVLFGKFLGDLLAVLLVTLKITSNLDTINYISLTFSVASLIIAIVLPHVQPRVPTQREIIERELQTPSGLSNSDTLRKSPWECETERRQSMQSADVQGVIDSYAHVNDPAFTAYARSNMFSDIDTSSIGFYGDFSTSDQFESSINRSESIGEISISSRASISSRGENSNSQNEAADKTKAPTTQQEKLTKFVKDLKKAYTELTVIYWSAWLVVNGLGFWIIQDTFFLLLDEIAPGRPYYETYNAGTITLATLLGCGPVLLYGILQGTCQIYSELIITVSSLISCILLTLIPNTTNIWLIYTMYILYYLLFQLGFVMALFLIGDILQSRRYGFIFGCNLFLVVAVKLILSAILENGLHLAVSTQVTVTGVMIGLFGLGFLIKMLYNVIKAYSHEGGCCGHYRNPQDRDLLVAST